MAETKATILARLLSQIDEKYDRTAGSFFFDTQAPYAAEAEKLYAEIEKIADRGFVSTATGEDLDSKVAEVGITRLPAVSAVGSVTFTGTAGTAIANGTKVCSDALSFSLSESGVIAVGGTVTLPAVCDVPGEVGNVPAGAITGMMLSSADILSVTNSTAFTGGYDGETDAELRERYLKHVSRPPTSGNKYHYEEWAKEADGHVGDALCVPLWNGAGTVKVFIITDERTVPDATLIAKVSAYIEAVRPIGATVTMAGATPKTIDVEVEVTLDGSASLATVADRIESNLTAYFKEISFRADYVSYAQVGRVILETAGVADYSGLLVNEGTANVSLSLGEIPVLGDCEVTEDD